MAEQRYVAFIEEIIQQTKKKKLKWWYLDNNKDLYQGMGWAKSKAMYGLFTGGHEETVPDFNVEDSFYTNVGDMYIVLYVWGSQPAKLFIVPNTYKKVTTLSPEEYGEHVTRLLNLVQSLFPSAEAFIDRFLESQG